MNNAGGVCGDQRRRNLDGDVEDLDQFEWMAQVLS